MESGIMRAGPSGAAITIGPDAVEAFARRWPCFGDPRRRIYAEFGSRGDLIDVLGDEGLDGAGVAALLDDAKAQLQSAGYLPA